MERTSLSGWALSSWLLNKPERDMYLLPHHLLNLMTNEFDPNVLEKFNDYTEDNIDVTCLMLGCMDYRLRTKYQSLGSAYEILSAMKAAYKESATAERFNTFLAMMEAKLVKGTSVSDHVTDHDWLFWKAGKS